jgi:hypothetical protein
MRHSKKIRTVEDAINLPNPTIALFAREKGKDFTEGLLMGWLVYLNDMLNLNKPMTEDQIEMCAISILEEFSALKMTDLTLLFKKIISGQYGELYESLSIAKVLTYFRNYFDERCNVAGQISLSSHNELKSDETFNITTNVKRIFHNKSKHISK